MSNNSNNAKRDESTITNAVLDALVIAHEAQAKALKRLRSRSSECKPRKRVGMSQLDLVEDILAKSGTPLHISEILRRIEREHGARLERESVVSSLAKKVVRNERFLRTAKNTFALKGGRS
ncbi:MAG: HTH domain-containing protein [Candidatus Sumerlaeota bacterium]|nr:HTH domain-containing protein [Candidatus Sumerlaeota bacterium]